MLIFFLTFLLHVCIFFVVLQTSKIATQPKSHPLQLSILATVALRLLTFNHEPKTDKTMDIIFDYTDASTTEDQPSKAHADTDTADHAAMPVQPDDDIPLTARNSSDYQEMTDVMFRIIRNHEAEIVRLNKIISEQSTTISEMFNSNTRLKSDLQHAREQKLQDEQRLEQMQTEMQQLKAQLQQLQKEQPFPTGATAMPPADNILIQRTLGAIHEEYLRNQPPVNNSLALQAARLPVQARATSVSRQHRQKAKPLDWDYFDELIQRDNKMSEFNNDRAKMFFNALHINNIIDEHFHLRRNITNNVACFIEKELHQRIPTVVKWEIFDHLFDRKAVRTYEGKIMKPSDRNMCKSIKEILDQVELAASQEAND